MKTDESNPGLGRRLLSWLADLFACMWTGLVIEVILGVLAVIAVLCKGSSSRSVVVAGVLYVVLKLIKTVGGVISREELKVCKGKLQKADEDLRQLDRLKSGVSKTFEAWLLYIITRSREGLASKSLLGSDCRATFYIFDDRGGENDSLRFVARESLDKVKKRKGRDSFSVSFGVIGKVWTTTKSQSAIVPKAIKERSEYERYVVEHQWMDAEAASKLKMLAHTIIGTPILSVEGRKLGVCVIESTEFIEKDERKDIIKRFEDCLAGVSPALTPLFVDQADFLFCQEGETV